MIIKKKTYIDVICFLSTQTSCATKHFTAVCNFVSIIQILGYKISDKNIFLGGKYCFF